jgi:hypothetical protein
VTFTVGAAAPSSVVGRSARMSYRSYGGQNTKDRPAYYGKLLALSSLLRAVSNMRRRVEVIFLNDGRSLLTGSR